MLLFSKLHIPTNIGTAAAPGELPSGEVFSFSRFLISMFIFGTFKRALIKSSWCSVDPVCSEIGSSTGQGPNSSNLSACHNCALVPETSCEMFNSFLDRTLVTGDYKNRSIGFMGEEIKNF